LPLLVAAAKKLRAMVSFGAGTGQSGFDERASLAEQAFHAPAHDARSRVLSRLFDRPPIRVTRFNTPDERREVGVRFFAAELHGHLDGERQLNVGAGQFVANEIVSSCELAVQKAEVPLHFTFNARLQRCSAIAKPACVELEHERQHGRTFRVVQKLQITIVVTRVRRGCKPAVSILAHQIFNDSAGLEDHFITIPNHGRLSQRMNLLKFRRGQARLWIALVSMDGVVESEFFEQPRNASRPGFV
jgi:hypothetical protein